jgi:putative transposase
VRRSGFYAYQQRQTIPKVDTDDGTLVPWIKAIAARTRHSYGSRRMAKHLQAEGYAVGRHTVRRLMK